MSSSVFVVVASNVDIPGGYLFQSYLDTFADWRTHKIWKKYKEWYNLQLMRPIMDSDAEEDNQHDDGMPQPSDDDISSDNLTKLFD